MRQLFDLESPLMEFLYKVFDCVCLSVLWVLCSIPVITMGAASAALYTSVYHCLHLDEPYPVKTFFQAFRENLRRSTLVWLVVLAGIAVLTLDAMVFRAMIARGEPFGQLYWVILFSFCVMLTWAAYLSVCCARCNGSAKEVLRMSFLLMRLHPICSDLTFLPAFAALVLGLMVPGLVLLLPAPVCWLGLPRMEQILQLHTQPERSGTFSEETERRTQQ